LSVSMCRRDGLYPCKTTPFSLHLTPPRLRTGESMHLVCFWPSPTSMARRDHQRWASAVQCGGGSERFVRFYVQKGWIISMQNDPILATFDTAPSPHGRINAPSLLLAFAHIQGKAGTPTVGIWSPVVGRNGLAVFMWRRDGLYISIKKTTPFSLHLTQPRLRTGESMHLVYFLPSPTSRARREHQRWASAVQCGGGSERFVRFYVQKGWIISMQNDPILATFDTAPSPHRRINAPSLLLAFTHIHGEAETPTLAIWSSEDMRKNLSTLWIVCWRRQ
jgi:hypothetical protein